MPLLSQLGEPVLDVLAKALKEHEGSDLLRRRGRIAILDQPVTTSGRAWQRAGVLRATAANQLVIAGYHLGIPSATLARFRRWALSRKRP